LSKEVNAVLLILVNFTNFRVIACDTAVSIHTSNDKLEIIHYIYKQERNKFFFLFMSFEVKGLYRYYFYEALIL